MSYLLRTHAIAIAAPLAALRIAQKAVAATQAATQTPLDVERHVNLLLKEVHL